MEVLQRPVRELAYYQDITRELSKLSKLPLVYGCVDQQKPVFVRTITENFRQKLIVTHNEIRARELYEDLRAFDRNTYYYPAKDFIFYSADIHGNELVRDRLDVIARLVADEDITVVTTIDGCLDRLMLPQVFKRHVHHLKVGDELDVKAFCEDLVAIGYERTTQVEHGGQFSVRGGILDIYGLAAVNPCRVELWDTEIDSLRYFDVDSQRSVESVEELMVFPATELIIEDYLSEGMSAIEADTKKYAKALEKNQRLSEAARIRNFYEELKERIFVLEEREGFDSLITYFSKDTMSLVDYFGRNESVIVLDEPVRLEEKLRVSTKEFTESMTHRLEKGQVLPGQLNALLSEGELYSKIGARHALAIASLDCKLKSLAISEHYNLNGKGIGSYHKSFETLIKDIENWKKRNYRIVIMSASKMRAQRIASDLMSNDVTAIYSENEARELVPGEVMTIAGRLRKGFEFPDIRFVAVTEDDIFGVTKKVRRKKTTYEGQAIASFSELSVGDYVVHENHGLGIYQGIEKVTVDRVEKDYIKIQYAQGGELYIPVTKLDMIQKYAAADAKKPKLNRLGSQEWSRTKSKVQKAVSGVAEELIRLYAARQQKTGYVYGPDTPWQREFEELFPYEPTEDQETAITDTKRDMESTKIMDRLICGDVGFGKTEVALRAAFKAAHSGKQVAYLVPTTILAKQHYSTFDMRMKDFGVEVRMLSRFCTPSEIRDCLEGLRNGTVDIVIGTHRILSKDVHFKDLGLLIIDEEQRFGVSHKEKIKQLKETVDVMTLTATPIPRTLHMSLAGIRDMSVLEEAPVDRLPIQTFVTEYDEEMVREAIHRELARGGQVYYVYNRVRGIDEFADSIQKLVPEANLAYAHGQMKERELEGIMMDFVNGDIDVLVSTTIIETGLDIPNVNTIIIHDSDRFGLSQLYQLRGRVGRSGRAAYAFLFYRRDRLLREVAEKRLSAIREFTELGSGIKIAMKDLEIRGAGNVLGEEQHGHMEAVGYDLYCKMLNEAVLDLKGEKKMSDYETEVDIDVSAFIPSTYIRSENQKLNIYKRIASLSSDAELEDMTDELIDRFGDLPKTAQYLMQVALLKSLAHEAYIIEIHGDKKELRLKMFPKAQINPERMMELLKNHYGDLKFANGEIPYFTYYFHKEDTASTPKYLDTVKKLVLEIGELREEAFS